MACRTKIEGNMILKPGDFQKKSKENPGTPSTVAIKVDHLPVENSRTKNGDHLKI